MKNTLTTLFHATVVLMVSFGAFPNAWGQTAGTDQTQIVKIRTLQIDAAARPGAGQFVPADDESGPDGGIAAWVTRQIISQKA